MGYMEEGSIRNHTREVLDGEEKALVGTVLAAWQKISEKFPDLEIRIMEEGKVCVMAVTDHQGVASIKLGVFIDDTQQKIYDIDIGHGYYDSMKYEVETGDRYIEGLIGSVYRDYLEED